MRQAVVPEQQGLPSSRSGSNGGHDPPRMVLSSNSSSSASSRSTFTSTSAVFQTPGRSMEEVWKDINLGTAIPLLDNSDQSSPYYGHHHHHRATAGATCDSPIRSGDLSLTGVMLQDFLGRPVKRTGPAPGVASVQPAEERGHHGEMRVPGHRAVAQAPRRSSPATTLSLNSGADFQYMDAASAEPLSPSGFPNSPNLIHGQHHGISSQLQPPASSLTLASSSDVVGSPSPFPGIFPFCNKKRGLKQQLESTEVAGGDGRHKRMVKNRESAARSRARKQAYINELELEVNHLTEENERLRIQCEELRAKMAAQQLSKKKKLQRSDTAPF